ncbi:MAG: hypothetical protein WD824_15205 [Cyclobacteriaceae bacterium]
MFTSISWQEFFLVISFSVVSYYCLATLLLFRQEITSLFRGHSFNLRPADEVSEFADSGPGIMGTIQHQEESVNQRTSINAAWEIEVFPSNDDPETFSDIKQGPSPENAAMLIGSVADLLQEIKTLVELVGEYKSAKEEGSSLFQTLFSRYPHLRESIYQEPINLYIYQTAKSTFDFDLELQEIRQWWAPVSDGIIS